MPVVKPGLVEAANRRVVKALRKVAEQQANKARFELASMLCDLVDEIEKGDDGQGEGKR